MSSEDQISSPETSDSGNGEVDHTVSVREFALEDLNDLRPVLESTIVNPFTKEIIRDEVEETLKSLEQSLESKSSRSYFVVQSPEGRVIGMMGLDIPSETMARFATTPSPIEIVNAYVIVTERGSGAGRSLVEHVESVAKSKGYTEIILNSGPRYMRTGWPFWRRIYGEPVGVAKKYYDHQWDAPVWHKVLE